MKLSIITINFNNRDGLQKTIDSVVCQSFKDYEWIIIDGGSTDGSKELIEKYQEHFAYWCSEPDKGIYNAMNKGISKAKGEYLQFLNSGDYLVDKEVESEFVRLEWEESIVSGDIILDDKKEMLMRNPDEKDLDFDYLRCGSLMHPSSYIKKSLFEQYGMYDENLRIVADWKFFLEVLIIHNCSYKHWDRIVANYYTDGISGSIDNHQLHAEERRLTLYQYERIIRSIDKRDNIIQELNLPVMFLLRKKFCKRMVQIFRRIFI